jgi:hypothetical protein
MGLSPAKLQLEETEWLEQGLSPAKATASVAAMSHIHLQCILQSKAAIV